MPVRRATYWPFARSRSKAPALVVKNATVLNQRIRATYVGSLPSDPVTIPPFRVLFATPILSNSVRVYLSEEPRHRSSLGATDALNRLLWTLSLVSGPGTIPVVEQPENPQPRPLDVQGVPTAWSVDLRADRPMRGDATYLVVASSALVSLVGDAMAAPPLDRAQYPGDAVKPSLVPLRPGPTVRGIDLKYDTFLGVYVLTPKGDVDAHFGVEALKKRIIRRMLSTPGGFYHLAGYGVGLRNKELLRTTSLSALKARILAQVLEEDDVAAAAVDVERPSHEILIVRITVRTRFERTATLQFDVPDEGKILIAA